MKLAARSFLLALYFLAILHPPASAQLAPRWQAMNQPAEPFRIMGNLFLASHTEFFDLAGKRLRLGQEGVHPFVDPDGYRHYLERARHRFEQAREAPEEASGTGGGR